jgi:endonuclease/exonuclease/phosphatase family metal-dependent hydrolase
MAAVLSSGEIESTVHKSLDKKVCRMRTAAISKPNNPALAGCRHATFAIRGVLCLALLLFITACSNGNDNDTNDRATADTPDVTIASVNILHGLFCAPETADCRLADRQDLLFDWIESIDCPDVVLLQEVTGPRAIAALLERVSQRCGAVYQVLVPPFVAGQNYTLTRYPVLQTNQDMLMGGLRILWHAQIDHPTGMIDVFNTHLAAGIDLQPCDASCPQECRDAGAANSRECQAVQIARLTEERAAPNSLRLLGGDFNAEPGSFVYRRFVEMHGWGDAYQLAGNAECDPASGRGCTSGRADEDLSEMELPASGESRRIDYLFIQLPAATTSACRYELDSRRDDDGDGLATRIFADDPNPFVERCGPLPEAICWPSDHEGMQADLNCR